MHIIAHRGITSANEKNKGNSRDLLLSALSKGFGIETDLRDFLGRTVVSHDSPNQASLSFEDLISGIGTLKEKQVLALNIKSDGQHHALHNLFQKFKASKPEILENAFFFDMSLPSLYQFSKIFPEKNLATRISDLEPSPLLYGKAGWIWVDCFEKDWFGEGELQKFMKDRKKICFISPELHNRPHLGLWKKLKRFDHEELYLCTDLALEAKSFFEGEHSS